MNNRRDIPFVQTKRTPFTPPAQEKPVYPTRQGNWLAQLQFGAVAHSFLEIESIEREVSKYLSSDETIKSEVYKKVYQVLGLDPSIVDVEVDNGTVKLIGVSPSEETQVSITEAITSVPGVQSVSYQIDV